jgi:Tfp pilus assembly protein PilO
MTLPLKPTAIDAAAVALLGVITAGAYLGGYQPARRAQAEVRTREDSLRQAEDDLAARTRELREVRADIDRVRASLAELPPVASLQDQPRRVGELASAAADLGVTLQELAPREARREGRWSLVPVRLTGSCRLDQVRRFVDELRRRFPDMEVASVDISRSATAPDEPGAFTLELIWHVGDGAGGAGGRGAGGAETRGRG